MKFLRNLLLVLALGLTSLVAGTEVSDARAGHGGYAATTSVPNCPQGLTYSAFDGCQGAQANGSSGVNANALTAINSNIPYSSPPPYNIPRRDYPVGYDTTLTLTPVASWTPPSNTGCSVNTGTHIVTCNTNSATCANSCNITQVDFNDYRIIFSGAGTNGHTWNITNNRFKNGTTVGVANAQLITMPTGVRINLNVIYNEFDGDSGEVGYDKVIGNVNGGTDINNQLTYNIKYNWFHNIPGNPLSINSTYNNVNIEWNYFDTFDQDQWTANNVDIDSVAQTINIKSFATTGTNLVHAGQGNSCLKYPSLPVNTASPTSIPITIGTQVSGIPGGVGVYNYTGTTTTQTGIILECGRGLHGEINLSGIDDQTVQPSMYTRGNLIVYGSDCPANGTANNAIIVSPGRYVSVTDAHIDYNVMINRISGNGKGCAAHALNNNGMTYYNSLDISMNYIDPTNTAGFQGNSTTSCFFWPSAYTSVTASQTGTTMTVTAITGAGPIPKGTVMTNGSTTYGYVTDNSLANSDGTGAYTMSDSRTQTFTGTSNAPNLANAAGTIPYAPFFNNNINMLKSGAASLFVISDPKMTTSAGCSV